MSRFRIIYRPSIDEEEKKILKEILGEDLKFAEYKTKSITGGAFDVQIIIDTLNDPTITAIIHGAELVGILTALTNRIFKRNTKKIMDNDSRPRYTILEIKRETDSIVISNANRDNKVLITKHSANFSEIKKQAERGDDEYSDEKMRDYLSQN